VQESAYLPSIVIAVGLGGLCLVTYLGLGRIADRVDALELRLGPSAASRTDVPGPGSAVPVTPPPDPAALERDSQLRLRDQAQNQFSQQQPVYVERCWPRPAAVRSTKPPVMPARFDFAITFDAAGNETRREVVLVFPSQSPLADCVKRQSLPKLRIPPPAKEVTTTVSLAIP
jgi:hypothetical protein